MNTPDHNREDRIHHLAREWADEVDGETADQLRQIRQRSLARRPVKRPVWQPLGWAASAAVLVLGVSVAFWPAGQPDVPDSETLAALASELPALMEPELLEAVDELVLMDAEALLLELEEGETEGGAA